MLPEEADGKTFGADDCFRLVGSEAWDYCESADVGKMLLEFILGSAFHAMSALQTQNDWAGSGRSLTTSHIFEEIGMARSW